MKLKQLDFFFELTFPLIGFDSIIKIILIGARGIGSSFSKLWRSIILRVVLLRVEGSGIRTMSTVDLWWLLSREGRGGGYSEFDRMGEKIKTKKNPWTKN